jgi:predicted lactoylglutathione lyase
MPQAIYVNLPVADLKRSMVFFEALGFSFNQQFTDDAAAALVMSETIFAMLHTPDS